MNMRRFDTKMGNDGFNDLPSQLLPFDGLYRFMGRTFGITIWCRDFVDARTYCRHHGLRLDGQIVHREETD